MLSRKEKEVARNALVSEGLSIIGVLILVLLGILLPQVLVPLREHTFSIMDASIAQPFIGGEVFSSTSTVIVAVIIPLLIFFVEPLVVFCKTNNANSFMRAYYWLSGYGTGLGITISVVEIIKHFAQTMRPDFLSRCFPGGVPANIKNNPTILVSTKQCTSTDQAALRTGLSSFPSGHSAISFYGGVFLCLYFYFYFIKSQHEEEGEQRVLAGEEAGASSRSNEVDAKDPDGSDERLLMRPTSTVPAQQAGFSSVHGRTFQHSQKITHAWVYLILAPPIIYATLNASSRLFDNRHHIVDVVSGTFLGGLSAFIFYIFTIPNVEVESKQRRKLINV